MGAQIVNFRPSGEQSWAQSAECAKPGKPLMFPHEGDADGVKLARDVCNVCPVRQQCLDEALARNESFGIWGGLTTDERRALRQHLRAGCRDATREVHGRHDRQRPRRA